MSEEIVGGDRCAGGFGRGGGGEGMAEKKNGKAQGAEAESGVPLETVGPSMGIGHGRGWWRLGAAGNARMDGGLESGWNRRMSPTPRKDALNWFEIAVNDFDRARRFYSEILGVVLTEVNAGGTRMALFPHTPESGVGGTLTQIPETRPGLAGTIIYLNVDGDLDGVLERIPAAGGRILRPRSPIGEQGAIAVFMDPEGNVVGLHSYS